MATRVRSAGRWRARALALALTIVTVILAALNFPLAAMTGDLSSTYRIALVLLVATVGVVLALRRPSNPIGWLSLTITLIDVFILDARSYSALDFRSHHGTLPLGSVAALCATDCWILLFLLIPLVILLFPDGRLSPRWNWMLLGYATLSLVTFATALGHDAVWMTEARHIVVNADGQFTNNPSAGGAVAVFDEAVLFLLPAAWCSFVLRQVVAWRRATGDLRQQLKWLMTGSAITIVALVVQFLAYQFAGAASTALIGLSNLCAPAVAIAIGIGVLKYRLYDIDRVISRTVSYGAITAVLVGVYVGLVTVATHVLAFATPIGVAASTLAAAALFHPLRRRAQDLVDRRFNRSRYDAERAVSAFAARLRDTVELEAVKADLLATVTGALGPNLASLWLSGDTIGAQLRSPAARGETVCKTTLSGTVSQRGAPTA